MKEYFPKVVQVLPNDDFTVTVYFDNGKIVMYDASTVVGKGVFEPLKDIDYFKDRCTVLNDTLAWDIDGDYNPETCLDIDPITLYEYGQSI